MDRFLGIVLPLLVLSFGLHVRGSTNKTGNAAVATIGVIYVTNGQIWGSWGNQQLCPTGKYATGFSLKIQPNGGSDNTALNGVALRCTPPRTPSSPITGYSTVNSATGSLGTWMPDRWCPSGQLAAFQLRVQANQGNRDDTAVNNIRFKCTDGSVVEGNGQTLGQWGSWSQSCAGKGICGIQTKLQPNQGELDDTAVNDVQFFCCS